MPDRFIQLDPATGEVGREWPLHDAAARERIVAGLAAAWPAWAALPAAERARRVGQLGRALTAARDDLAATIVREMGKPIAQAWAEIDKSAGLCAWLAEHAQAALAPERVWGPAPGAGDGERAEVWYCPLGVVLAIMPWNFPVWQVVRAVLPALCAGNVALLKPAPSVPGCAERLIELAAEALEGAPVWSLLRVDAGELEALIADPRIAAVTLTGSTRAGRAVARAAGQALKPTVLELGGSDPYVVLDDADPEFAAELCAEARMVNGGQSCVAAKRMIVTAHNHERFVAELVARLGAWVCGDPRDPATRLGPLARVDLRDELAWQVERSIELGARCLLGGRVPDRAGAWYPATVLASVGPGMPAFDDELFGPVAAVVCARDDDHALALAGQTRFGLGACVIGRDRAAAERLAQRRLAAGSCFVNTPVRSDARLPFGGIADSGWGRELGVWGLRSFVNVKTVVSAAHRGHGGDEPSATG